MRPPANPGEKREKDIVVGKTYTSDTYHFLTENSSESLCGMLKDKKFLGSSIDLILTETDAEQQEFALCAHCARLADT